MILVFHKVINQQLTNLVLLLMNIHNLSKKKKKEIFKIILNNLVLEIIFSQSKDIILIYTKY